MGSGSLLELTHGTLGRQPEDRYRGYFLKLRLIHKHIGLLWANDNSNLLEKL